MTRPLRGISVFGTTIDAMADAAAAAERAGFDSVWTQELYNRSATITLAAIAERTSSATIGSAIMYGVGRSPLMVAAEARDLDELSAGRLVLGLGNGTRTMIRDWHGQDGSAPAARMEELVPLVRRLWRLHEAPVEHDGRFHRVRIRALPGLAAPARDIPIYTAGVNRRMIEAAGRVADGLLGHPLFSPRYVEEVARPALRAAGREPVLATLVLACANDDEEQARRDAASMIAFYGSVATYGPLFEVCGFAREAAAIRDAFARGDAKAMAASVTDAMVDALAVAGTPEQVEAGLRRYDGIADHVILSAPTFGIPRERVEANLATLVARCAPVSRPRA